MPIRFQSLPAFNFRAVRLGFLLLLASQTWGAGAQDEYQIGLTLYKQGHYAQAVSHFQSAVQTDPSYWQAFQLLGQSQYQSGDKAGALNTFDQSLKLHPDNPSLRNFTERLRKTLPPPVPGTEGTRPVSALGMSAKPLVNPASRMQPAFAQVYATFGSSIFTDLSTGFRVLNNLTFNPNSQNTTDLPYLGMGVELGYCPDRNDCFSMNLELASVYGFSINSNDPTDQFTEKLSNQLMSIGLNYAYMTPDKDGPWIARFGVAYYLLGFSYSESEVDISAAVSQQVSLPAGTGTALGASVALGKDFDLGGFSLELLGKVKMATISQMTGAYTATGGPNPNLGTSGMGALAVRSDGVINVVDQSQMGTSGERYARMELLGFELRAGLNYRF